MQKITNRLFKVEDAAGKTRLVRGVDAREIEAVARQEAESGKQQNDLIAEADEMLAAQAKEARAQDGQPIEPDLVEGVTTTPRSLLRSNEPDMPVNDAMFRESQNNPPNQGDAKTKEVQFPADFPKDYPGASIFRREGVSFTRAQTMSEDELGGINGIGEATVKAILKQRKTGR